MEKYRESEREIDREREEKEICGRPAAATMFERSFNIKKSEERDESLKKNKK